MTARPLADCTLAPSIPATSSSAKSGQNACAAAAAISTPPQPPTPRTSTSRSPNTSVAYPQGISDTTEPASDDEISTPVWPSERSKRLRRNGAITAMPNQIAEYVVWANVPAASTTQRFGRIRGRTGSSGACPCT